MFFYHFLFPAEFVPVRYDMAVVAQLTSHPVPIRAIVAESGKLPLTSFQVHLENTGREEGRDPPGMCPMISNPGEGIVVACTRNEHINRCIPCDITLNIISCHIIPCHTIPYNHTMTYFAIRYHAISLHVILCNTTPCDAVPCISMHCHSIPCHWVSFRVMRCKTLSYEAFRCHTMPP